MGKIKWVETIIDGTVVVEEWHTITAYVFNMGDVEDPEIYAGHGIHQWQQTNEGKFIMEHAKDHTFNIGQDYNTYGYKCAIRCSIEKKKYSEFLLKFRQ